MNASSLRRSHLAAVCGLVTALVAVANLAAGLGRFDDFARWELRFRDFLMKHGRALPPDPRLVFVGIDNDSVSIEPLDLESLYAGVPRDSADFRALSLMAQPWPWPREVYALLLDKLFAAGVRGVALDLLFPKASGDDAAFHDALERYQSRATIGCNFILQNVAMGVEAPVLALPTGELVPQSAPLGPGVAFVNFWPDDADGIVRRARFKLTLESLRGFPRKTESEVYLSLATRAAGWLEAGTQVPPEVDTAPIFRYTAPSGKGFPPVSAYQLFVPRYWAANFADGKFFRDKVVVIGQSGNWAHDEHDTPLGIMPGPEIHLNVLNAILQRGFVHEAPRWIDLLLICLAGAVAWLISLFNSRAVWQILRVLGVNAAGLLLAFVLFNEANLYTAAIAPLLAFNINGAMCFVYEFVIERRDKARTRRTLERYVSKDVVRELLDNRQSLLHTLGGQRRRITVLFSDLRGFTTLTETADAVTLVSQLNEYFQQMVRIVFAHGGTLDKFIGDGLMAHWGSIVTDGERTDACNAVRTVLEMRVALAELNARWAERGWPRLECGLGLNSGEAIVGNIGCEEKMEVSVIGDPVNLASRIEGATKQYRVDLLIGDAVAALIGEEFVLRTVDQLRVRGKSHPVEVFTVLGERKADEPVPAWLPLHEEAVSCYRRREFAAAVELCDRALALQPEDWLLQEYRRRCEIYAVQPPGENWSGVQVLSQK